PATQPEKATRKPANTWNRIDIEANPFPRPCGAVSMVYAGLCPARPTACAIIGPYPAGLTHGRLMTTDPPSSSRLSDLHLLPRRVYRFRILGMGLAVLPIALV